MNPGLISILSAMAAASWSIWTWKSERHKERELKRDEMSAQYVNSLLLCAQELQRLLYKILEEDELAHYRQENPEPCEPASPPAIDLLYSLSQFFGWQLMTYRFGPYTRDPRMISFMAQVGEIMESRSRFPGDAFRFSMGDRLALGRAVLQPFGELSSRPTFVASTRFEFEEDITNEQSERARLFRSKAVRRTLAAIDRADRAETLEGHERLAVLQNLLVDLLSYLEHEEGFRVHFGERRRATVETPKADVDWTPSKEVRILHQLRGRVRLGIPRLHADKTYAAHLQSLLQPLNYVKSVRVNADAGCVVIEYLADAPLLECTQAVVAEVENDFASFRLTFALKTKDEEIDYHANKHSEIQAL